MSRLGDANAVRLAAKAPSLPALFKSGEVATCFSQKLELFHLAIPFLVAIPLFFFPVPRWQDFIVSILFMQLAHTALTYLMLARLPEFSEWFRSDKRIWGPKSILSWAFGLGALVLFTFMYRTGPYFTNLLRGDHFILVLAWVTALLQYQHFFAQGIGFHSIYDENLRRQTGRVLEPTFKKRERFLLRLMFWWGVFQIFGFAVLRLKTRLLAIELELEKIYWISGYALLAFPVLLLINTLFSGYQFYSPKFIYQLRLFFWPMSFLWPKWGLVLVAAHGVEYVLLSRQMIQNSKASNQEKRDLWISAWPLFLVFSILSLPSAYIFGWWLEPRFPKSFGLFNIGLSFSLFISFYHYYLDALIFRLKDPEIRRLIGPLIGEKA